MKKSILWSMVVIASLLLTHVGFAGRGSMVRIHNNTHYPVKIVKLHGLSGANGTTAYQCFHRYELGDAQGTEIAPSTIGSYYVEKKDKGACGTGILEPGRFKYGQVKVDLGIWPKHKGAAIATFIITVYQDKNKGSSATLDKVNGTWKEVGFKHQLSNNKGSRDWHDIHIKLSGGDKP